MKCCFEEKNFFDDSIIEEKDLLCTTCATGAYFVTINDDDIACRYIGSLKNNTCPFYKKQTNLGAI